LLLELAKDKNSQPLPLLPNKLGVLLPPDQYCLTSQTYQLDAKKLQNIDAPSTDTVLPPIEEMDTDVNTTTVANTDVNTIVQP